VWFGANASRLGRPLTVTHFCVVVFVVVLVEVHGFVVLVVVLVEVHGFVVLVVVLVEVHGFVVLVVVLVEVHGFVLRLEVHGFAAVVVFPVEVHDFVVLPVDFVEGVVFSVDCVVPFVVGVVAVIPWEWCSLWVATTPTAVLTRMHATRSVRTEVRCVIGDSSGRPAATDRTFSRTSSRSRDRRLSPTG